MVSNARFTSDAKTVVYGAAWGGEPTRIFQTRLGASESSPVQLPDAELFAISPVGELAIATGLAVASVAWRMPRWHARHRWGDAS